MAMEWQKQIQAAPASSSNVSAKLSPKDRTAKNMDDALAAFKAGNKDIKRPVITQVGDNVRFSVRFANTALKLVGEDTVFLAPKAKFEEIYAAIKESVLKGDFDKQLEPLEKRVAERGKALSASKQKK